MFDDIFGTDDEYTREILGEEDCEGVWDTGEVVWDTGEKVWDTGEGGSIWFTQKKDVWTTDGNSQPQRHPGSHDREITKEEEFLFDIDAW